MTTENRRLTENQRHTENRRPTEIRRIRTNKDPPEFPKNGGPIHGDIKDEPSKEKPMNIAASAIRQPIVKSDILIVNLNLKL